jgi:hypothetical protein
VRLGRVQSLGGHAPTIPRLSISTSEGAKCLIVPVSGYKNDTYGEGLTVTLYECKEAALCPVRTFQRWTDQTEHVHSHVRDCRIVFELQRPYNHLTPDRCAEILKGIASSAGLDPATFTAKTFRKSGIMAGIKAGIEPDALFHLGGWRDPNTFWRHYVVRHVPSTYTDILFNSPAGTTSSSGSDSEDNTNLPF